MTSAKIILDSWNGHARLTTMEIKFHRFILPEFNTHRTMSRNAASSRAIPVEKQIAAVMNNPAMPVFWGKNQPGMSAHEELYEGDWESARYAWLSARDKATASAEQLMRMGLHKQLATRLIEPFMWTTMIVSFTESDNFFELRKPPGTVMDPTFPAQPEIQVLALEMFNAMGRSEPVFLHPGEWHIPYLNGEDMALDLPDRLRVSAGRCARVSYLTHDGTRNVEKDLELADRLVSQKHFSPLEHQARCMGDGNRYKNFRGFSQYRTFVEEAHFLDKNLATSLTTG